MGGKYRLRQPPVAEPGQNQWLYWFQWVRIHDSSPTSKRPTSEAGGAVRGRWIRLPAFRWKAVRRKPVFALVLPTCHRHVGLKWVRIHDSSPTSKNPPAMLVAQCGGRWIRWPAFRGKAVRRKPVFALVFPTCHRHVGFEWVRIHLRFPHQQKGHHLLVMSFLLVGEGGFEPPKL